MGPVLAIPRALEQAKLSMKDVDLVEVHEAFAAQVACTLKALASRKFCEERLGLTEAVGEIDPARCNIYGGSIALGHPFAATGARLVAQTLHALRSENKQFGLMAICAGGGLGVAMVLEVAR
jgi:acetyl-CoA acyltransferase